MQKQRLFSVVLAIALLFSESDLMYNLQKGKKDVPLPGMNFGSRILLSTNSWILDYTKLNEFVNKITWTGDGIAGETTEIEVPKCNSS